MLNVCVLEFADLAKGDPRRRARKIDGGAAIQEVEELQRRIRREAPKRLAFPLSVG